jgi:drug/metabolite transporter (DMT)-like permease
MTNVRPSPPQPPPPPQRNGCLTALMIVVGAILLLPGICGVIVAALDPHELMVDPNTLLAVLGLILLGVGGIVLIWLAVRRPER